MTNTILNAAYDAYAYYGSPIYTSPIIMAGTIINVVGIVVGALIGVALKKRISNRMTAPILKIMGVVIAIISLNGIIGAMFRVDSYTGTLTSSGGFLLLVSMVIGCLIGELARIDDRINAFGQSVEARFGAEGFAKGFVSASLLFPIGAMAIIGPLYDGLMGDISVLLIKSGLDFTISIILASTLGIGVLFSFIPVLIVQGSITLLAGAIYPFVSPTLLDLFCMTGYVLVLCIGINFIIDAKIKVANLLPALLVTIGYYFIAY